MSSVGVGAAAAAAEEEVESEAAAAAAEAEARAATTATRREGAVFFFPVRFVSFERSSEQRDRPGCLTTREEKVE